MNRTWAPLPCILLGAGLLLPCEAALGRPAPRCVRPTVAVDDADLPTNDRDAGDDVLPLLGLQFRSRSSFKTDDEYGKYIETTLRVGWRVRAVVDYQNVKKGMTGVYYGANGGQPPCLVVWDEDVKASSTLLPNVPPAKASHAYWVYWHQVEIVNRRP